MASVNPIQPNIENTKPQTYRDANPPIKTEGLVKPLPAQGHLVHDTALSVPKFWIKDIAYDIKAVRDGYRGTANDHQLGRINDVGLKLGGIGIAGVLAARTSNPVLRIMEYVGLGTFLTAMSLYPKIAINTPSRVVQGFDIGKEYIDDQGRKKSVFQDSNYIPFDMYRGEFPDEDLDKIGDSMGIPRDIKNRHDIIKEQMRKIATQNNTLWMLTAGLATPVMTALICCGLEKLIAPAVEMVRNSKNNTAIENILKKTQEMPLVIDQVEPNSLSKKIEKIILNYKDKEIPKAEIDNIVKILAKEMNSDTLASAIKEDVQKLFKSEANGFAVSDKTAAQIIELITSRIPDNGNKEIMKRVFVPTEEEINRILAPLTNGSREITPENLYKFKGELKELFGKKIMQEKPEFHKSLKAYQNQYIIESISKSFKKNPVNFVTAQAADNIIDFAKVIGEFKNNEKIIDKCQNFKFEYESETALARSYAKFESAVLDVLGIKYKDLKQMRVSSDITKEILDKKLAELAKDEVRYQKAIEKLSGVIADMEMKLNGESFSQSYIKDMITAIENNYNNTAKRMDSFSGKFAKTINALCKEDLSTLTNSIETREDLFKFLDGLREDKPVKEWTLDYARENAKGNGSAKNEAITRLVDRYQGAKNSFLRMIHAMDFYRAEMPSEGYAKEVAEKAKETVLGANSSNHTLKLNTINNPDFYKDIMWKLYSGKIDSATVRGMENFNDIEAGNILDRFQSYIKRFRNVMGNNDVDFKTPKHMLGKTEEYSQKSTTRISKFNLVGQNPIDMVKNAAERRYGNQKWLRIASTICGVVLGGTVLAQFAFGKIKNPHNIQKQVSDDTNN